MKKRKSVRPVLLAADAPAPEEFRGKPGLTGVFAGLLHEKRGYAHKGMLQVWIETYDGKSSSKKP